MKTKAKNLAKLYKAQNPEYDDYDIYWLFAGYKAGTEAIKEMNEFGFGLLVLQQSKSNIEVKITPNKKF